MAHRDRAIPCQWAIVGDWDETMSLERVSAAIGLRAPYAMSGTALAYRGARTVRQGIEIRSAFNKVVTAAKALFDRYCLLRRAFPVLNAARRSIPGR
eukprot:1836478-Rhodomonas_salina.2